MTVWLRGDSNRLSSVIESDRLWTASILDKTKSTIKVNGRQPVKFFDERNPQLKLDRMKSN